MNSMRYTLNADDQLELALFTPGNSDALIEGVGVNGTKQFPVSVGGTGNDTFSTGEFLAYNPATDRIESTPGTRLFRLWPTVYTSTGGSVSSWTFVSLETELTAAGLEGVPYTCIALILRVFLDGTLSAGSTYTEGTLDFYAADSGDNLFSTSGIPHSRLVVSGDNDGVYRMAEQATIIVPLSAPDGGDRGFYYQSPTSGLDSRSRVVQLVGFHVGVAII